VSRGRAEPSDAARRGRFDALVAAHGPALEAAARRVCRDPAVAADLVQDTLERAWRKLEQLDSDATARAWLVRILRNTWIDQLRRRRGEVPMEDVPEPATAVADEPSRWERVTVEHVRAAIEALPEPFRAVAILHDLDGLSYDQIAARLAIPYATAATRLHRAHRKLRELLADQLGEGGPS
jgi:RNA polymerase sigma-70 factor (ECF subfamily)